VNLTFVGTSDAFGAGGRRQSAIFVETTRGGILLDCAPTTGTGLVALGIPRDAVDAIAISHFHADHFAGLPQFLLAAIYEDRRRHPLAIAGPRGIETRVRIAADAVGYSLTGRELPFELRFVEIGAGSGVDLGIARLDAFPVFHDPASCPHGLRVQADARTLVYSGDTGWFDGLPGEARGADLFVCECTFHAQSPVAEHLSYGALSERREAFACERMLLTHLGADMNERRGALEIETADDGLAIGL
jgi:ribonuclease BN (tRNA processing enzyme)